MYIPQHFKNEKLSELHLLIKEYNFGVLFSQNENTPTATHLPFMLDEKKGKLGTLSAHMAKDNPQWKYWNNETELLIVFQGPHFYVSPAWYKNQDTVPTWNYAAVHAYGIPKIIHSSDKVKPMLNDLINNHEKNIKEQWDRDLAEPKMNNLMKGIVAFEIKITKLEGKNKFSQNKSPGDIELVKNHASKYNPQIADEIRKIMK